MVLLHSMLHLQRLISAQVEVCHVDHGLRPCSASDASFVETWCQERGVPCHVVRLDQKPDGENLEAWARQQRYASFRDVMERRHLDILCTAHNANDVAETLLIRLIANKELNSIEEFDSRRRCIRPLLEISREQIDDYVREFGVPYVEDPTNQDTHFVRNRVRHELMPVLADTFDSSIVWILAERARSLAADSKALEELAAVSAAEVLPLVQNDRDWLVSCRQEIKRSPMAIQWRIVQIIMRPILGYAIGETKARSIVDALLVDGSVLQLNSELTLRVQASGIVIG